MMINNIENYLTISNMVEDLREYSLELNDYMEELNTGIEFAEKINDKELLEELCISYNKLNEARIDVSLQVNSLERKLLLMEKEHILKN